MELQIEPEHRPDRAPQILEKPDTPIGHVVKITGSRATVSLEHDVSKLDQSSDLNPFIGTMMAIDTGRTIVLGLITSMALPEQMEAAGGSQGFGTINVELVGELLRESDGYLKTCRRGVSVYPRLGEKVRTASQEILRKAYQYGEFSGAEIGVINQDETIPAVVRVDDMLGKHFAIVGSTGTGKSCVVALMLRQVLAKHPNAHIVLLDPHNEYGSCFDNQVELVTLKDLSMPFWFLTFEEAVETLIGDARKNQEEVEILRDLIPIAKRQFGSASGRTAAALLHRTGMGRARYSVDVPTPYLVSDLVALIDDQLGRLEKQNGLAPLKRLKARIETISQDPRFDFMFGSLTVHDNLARVLKRLFRIPVAGRPITVIQLMGLPSEIVNVVVSVLSRLAFDVAMASDGKIPITFVCEEAHRYVPRDSTTGFEPTKRSISRIAKEGRKYGASLCIVSQRPGDLDPTILSQCSTVFTMRLSNERDQRIIQSALSEATASMLEFLPSLGTREAIAFGEGVTLPSRIYFSELPQSALPRGGGAKVTEAWSTDLSDDGMLESIVERWRLSAQQANEDEHIIEAELPPLAASNSPADDPHLTGDKNDRRDGAPGRRLVDHLIQPVAMPETAARAEPEASPKRTEYVAPQSHPLASATADPDAGGKRSILKRDSEFARRIEAMRNGR